MSDKEIMGEAYCKSVKLFQTFKTKNTCLLMSSYLGGELSNILRYKGYFNVYHMFLH